jgi:hypothetical protein
MKNTKNIIIFLLTIIVLLNFLTFIKLKTYRIDNFTDNSNQDNYELYSTIITNRAVAYHAIIHAFVYSILLKIPLTDCDNVLGLIIFLSCNKLDIHIKCRPILEQMTIVSSNSTLLQLIQTLQSSLTTEQKESFEMSLFMIIVPYFEARTEEERKQKFNVIMSSFGSVIQKLKLSNEQLKNVKNILIKWSLSRNSYFTIENFSKLPLPITGEPDTLPWADFFKKCKI